MFARKNKQASESLGKRFGKLIVVEITTRRIKRHVVVKCKCDCGGEGEFDLSQIKAGRINSCGCLQSKASRLALEKAHKTNLASGLWSKDPKLGTAHCIYLNSKYNDGDISFEEFLELSQQNCFYCGSPPFRTFNKYLSSSFLLVNSKPERIRDGYFTFNGLDRVDSLLRHNKNNVVPCCYPCNLLKWDSTLNDFFLQVEKIYHHLLSMGLLKPCLASAT